MTEEVMMVPTREFERLTDYYKGADFRECFIEQGRTIGCRTTFDLEKP